MSNFPNYHSQVSKIAPEKKLFIHLDMTKTTVLINWQSLT